MALQSRKGKADDLTITISKSTSVSFSRCYTMYVSVRPCLFLTEALFLLAGQSRCGHKAN